MLRPAAAAILLLMSSAVRLHAQGSLLLEGIFDGEFWSTTAKSNLLTRNAGEPTGLGRVQLWGAAEPLTGLVFYGQGEVEWGRPHGGVEVNELYAKQYGVRYTLSPLFVLDAGRLTPVVGTFAARHFSTRNPLIGQPDGYSIEYPLGVELFGEGTHFDYRIAAVTRPTSHWGYQPAPTQRLRPAAGVGFTPVVGLRFGGSFTVGPYLNDNVSPTVLNGKTWDAYHQKVLAVDASFARGYLETHAEASRGTYDLPSGTITGFTYYGEGKYTLTPRFFVAARLERNKYPFIRPNSPAWTSRLTDFVDGEVGGGYRLTTSTLLKASIRSDRWWVREDAPGYLGDGGNAFAIQVSQAFDVLEWFRREQ
jgi:hypothetical protein